jgi:hypothetical protein
MFDWDDLWNSVYADYTLALDGNPEALPKSVQKKILAAAYILGKTENGKLDDSDCDSDDSSEGSSDSDNDSCSDDESYGDRSDKENARDEVIEARDCDYCEKRDEDETRTTICSIAKRLERRRNTKQIMDRIIVTDRIGKPLAPNETVPEQKQIKIRSRRFFGLSKKQTELLDEKDKPNSEAVLTEKQSNGILPLESAPKDKQSKAVSRSTEPSKKIIKIRDNEETQDFKVKEQYNDLLSYGSTPKKKLVKAHSPFTKLSQKRSETLDNIENKDFEALSENKEQRNGLLPHGTTPKQKESKTPTRFLRISIKESESFEKKDNKSFEAPFDEILAIKENNDFEAPFENDEQSDEPLPHECSPERKLVKAPSQFSSLSEKKKMSQCLNDNENTKDSVFALTGKDSNALLPHECAPEQMLVKVPSRCIRISKKKRERLDDIDCTDAEAPFAGNKLNELLTQEFVPTVKQVKVLSRFSRKFSKKKKVQFQQFDNDELKDNNSGEYLKDNDDLVTKKINFLQRLSLSFIRRKNRRAMRNPSFEKIDNGAIKCGTPETVESDMFFALDVSVISQSRSDEFETGSDDSERHNAFNSTRDDFYFTVNQTDPFAIEIPFFSLASDQPDQDGEGFQNYFSPQSKERDHQIDFYEFINSSEYDDDDDDDDEEEDDKTIVFPDTPSFYNIESEIEVVRDKQNEDKVFYWV